jgi:hypothetical protein
MKYLFKMKIDNEENFYKVTIAIYLINQYIVKIRKPDFDAELCYMDGLVSTGNQIPFTILKRIFAKRKKKL